MSTVRNSSGQSVCHNIFVIHSEYLRSTICVHLHNKWRTTFRHSQSATVCTVLYGTVQPSHDRSWSALERTWKSSRCPTRSGLLVRVTRLVRTLTQPYNSTPHPRHLDPRVSSLCSFAVCRDRRFAAHTRRLRKHTDIAGSFATYALCESSCIEWPLALVAPALSQSVAFC